MGVMRTVRTLEQIAKVVDKVEGHREVGINEVEWKDEVTLKADVFMNDESQACFIGLSSKRLYIAVKQSLASSLHSGKDFEMEKKKLANIACVSGSPQVAVITDQTGDSWLQIVFEEYLGMKKSTMKFRFHSETEIDRWEETILAYWTALPKTKGIQQDDEEDDNSYIPGIDKTPWQTNGNSKTVHLFCPMCGKELDYEGAAFCSFCGAEVEDGEAKAEAQVRIIQKKQSDLGKAFEWLEVGQFEKAKGCFDKVLSYDIRNGEAYLGKAMAELKVKNMGALAVSDTPLENNQNYLNAIRYSKPSLAEKLEGYANVVNAKIELQRLEAAYKTAVGHERKLINTPLKTGDADYAKRMRDKWVAVMYEFVALAEFRDSIEKVQDCKKEIAEWELLIKKENYNKAVEYVGQLEAVVGDETSIEYNEKLLDRWYGIRKRFLDFGDFLDSSQMISECDSAISECKYHISKRKYDDAINVMNSSDPEKLTVAVNQFQLLGDFEDSAQLLVECQEKQLGIIKREIKRYVLIWGIIALWGLIPGGGPWGLHLFLIISMLVCAAIRLVFRVRVIKQKNNTELENNPDFVKGLKIASYILAVLVFLHI